MSALYIYAVLSERPTIGTRRGVANEPLRIVSAAGLAVAVGTIEAPPPVALPELRRHDATVRALAARVAALVPMRFGQIVPNADALRECVERSSARLSRLLEETAGSEQWTIRLFRAGAGQDSSRPRPEDVGGAASPAAIGPGTRYLHERANDRRRAQAVPASLAPVLEPLSAVVSAERLENTETGPVRTSVYHLVRTALRDDYLARFHAAKRDLASSLSVTGPWPPYAFSGGGLAP